MAVNLVAHDVSADAFCDLDYLHEHVLCHQSACGIVRVIYAYHFCSGNGKGAQLVKIGQKAVFLAQVQKLQIRAEGFRDRVQLLIGRHDAYNAVARLNERVENVVVCTRCAVSGDYLLGLEGLVKLANAVFKLRRAFDIAVGQAL